MGLLNLKPYAAPSLVRIPMKAVGNANEARQPRDSSIYSVHLSPPGAICHTLAISDRKSG